MHRATLNDRELSGPNCSNAEAKKYYACEYAGRLVMKASSEVHQYNLPPFWYSFFHFQQIFEFLLCAGPCNMSWETRIKQQRWGLQTSCCGGSYMTPLPSWCTPKSKSESAIMVGHMDAGTRELEFKCWLLLLGLLLLLFAPQFVIFRMVVLMIPLMW